MLSRNPFKAKQFCNALSVSSCHLGMIQQRNSKEHTCKSGKGSVVEGLLIYCNISPNVNQVLKFLTELHDSNCSYSALKTERSSFSAIISSLSFQITEKVKQTRPEKHLLKLTFKAYAPDCRQCVYTYIMKCLAVIKKIDFCTLLHEHSTLKSHVIFKWLMVRYN